METCAYYYYPCLINSSPRAAAMVLALVSAVVLSPLYERESRWSSGGLVLPAVVAGLIVAIKTTTSSSKNSMQKRGNDFRCQDYNNNDASFAFRIGSSSWGLAGMLVMLLFVISWQSSMQQFFWK